MGKILRFLRSLQPKYDALVEVVIFRDRLLKNLEILRSYAKGIAIAPVLKSNAAGHGLIEVATILDKENVPFFAVDSYHEARHMRSAGIRSKVLVIGFTPIGNIARNRDQTFFFTITGLELLQDLSQNLKAPQIFHLKIDTGLSRQGIMPDQIDQAVELIKANPNIVLEGVYSHLADSSNEDEEFMRKQITLWNECYDRLDREFPKLKYYHLSATPGLKNISQMKCNLARIGKGLYGWKEVLPGIQPVLEMRAKITGIKKIRSGTSVGYGMTFTADRDMTVGTLAAGYFEGVDRRLSNIGLVKYGKKFCKILGRVNMNITVIDLTEIESPRIGDDVVIISSDRVDENSAEKLGELCGAIPYELLVHIPAHLRRLVV